MTTDSYKLGSHWNMLPEKTEYIHSYFESRIGAKYPYTMFFGLQPILSTLYKSINKDWIYYTEEYCKNHFGNDHSFNKNGWLYILDKLNGKLPLSIRAIPEGTKVPTGNVLMTVENTDPNCAWLPGYFETLLSKVWYTSTVATISSYVKDRLKYWMEKSCDSLDGLEFKLHDFGARSATCEEQAGLGGIAHLINFRGTDTTRAIPIAQKHYHAYLETLGFSVPATEHSVTCAYGIDGEEKFINNLLDKYPNGILSIVGDTYDIYNFVDRILPKFKDRILSRNGKVVVRPDSITDRHKTPEEQVVYLLSSLSTTFGSSKNNKGYHDLNPKVGVLWGDGLSVQKIDDICQECTMSGFSINPLVFGMGTGLIQNVNRDTQRFAFKASAICIDGIWKPIRKNPLDKTKSSKAGLLKLVKDGDQYLTVSSLEYGDKFNFFHTHADNELKEVFHNGFITKMYNFDQVRLNADNIWKGYE